MGTNNRQRRAAKAKRRARSQHDHARRLHERARQTAGPSGQPVEAARALLSEAAASEDGDVASHLLDGLVSIDRELLDPVAEAQLLHRLELLWRHGWQPSEIVRHVRRRDARAGRLVATAVVADHVGRPPSTLHPRWEAQVEALETPCADHRTGWLRAFAAHEVLTRPMLVASIVDAPRAVCAVGPVHEVLPPPGDGARLATSSDALVDDAMLAKVRALLAQAESTSFEAEADAFTAKAEELMARHAIDEAVLWAGSSRRDRPIAQRVPVDDPYADVKSLLLQFVAGHSRCRAVWDGRYGWSTVVGFPTDVAAAELLFTSLLVQAAAALQAEAATAGPGGRTRSRSFRSSFLVAFAHRIDRRLGDIAAAAADAADHGSSTLLPALLARDDAVAAEIDALFGSLTSNVVRRGHDAAGWARGALAADLAKLNAGDLRTGTK